MFSGSQRICVHHLLLKTLLMTLNSNFLAGSASKLDNLGLSQIFIKNFLESSKIEQNSFKRLILFMKGAGA